MHTKLQNLRLLDGRQVLAVVTAVLLLCAILATTLGSPKIEAANLSTINFQARLMNNTGSIAPDGNYNIEFKLYDHATNGGTAQGVCSGNCVWLETRTGGNTVTVANGYVTVNLGSVTTFGTGINWNQDLWLTMRVGGTGAPTWDTEMSPRLKLTAVPYAFRAAQLALQTGANTSTLAFDTQTDSREILLPDEDGVLCIQGSTECGFLTGSTGSFIQNGTSVQTAANFNIRSAATGSVGAVIQGENGQTADLLNLQTWNGTTATTVFGVNNVGALTLAGTGTALFTTTKPVPAQVPTKINIPAYDPGDFGQILAFGLPSGSSSTARAISVFDARATAHQPSIAVLSPNENEIGGFSWDGSSSAFLVKNTSSTGTIGLNVNGVTRLSATTAGALVDGVLSVATLGTANTTTYLCRNSSTDVAACNTTGNGAAFVQGGNDFDATAVLGTNDADNLQIETNNLLRATFDQSNGLYLGNGITAAAPNNFAVKGVGSSTAGTAGATLTIQGGAGASATTGSTGGGLLLAGGDAAGSGDNAGGNVTLQGGLDSNNGTPGKVLVKNSADSVTAFQVQNAAGTSTVLDIDTSNGRVGIGTAAPARTFDVALNTSTVNAPPLRVYQSGSGDASLELASATTGNSIYLGLDASNSGAFTIGSSTSASSVATPAHVQSAGVLDSTGNYILNLAQAMSSSPATGNLIVAAVSWDTNGGSTLTMSCSDTQSNVYTNLTLYQDVGHSQALQLCYTFAGANTSNTVTAAFGGSTVRYVKLTVSEFSGVASVSSVDTSTGQAATGTTSTDAITSGSTTTTYSGDLIFGAVVNTSDYSGISAGTGFTQRLILPAAGSDKEIQIQSMVQSTAGPVASTHTFNQADDYVSAMAAFKAAVTGMTDTYTDALFTLTQTGAAKFRNSDNSSTAFQVQNASGLNLFHLDTLSNITNLGATGTTNVASTVNIGTSTAAAQAVNIGSTTGGSSLLLQAGTGNITLNTAGTVRATFSNSNAVYFGNGLTASAPNDFAIRGTGSTTTAVAGGSLTIQGGNATVGSANGGNVTLTGGTGSGTGVRGLVVIDTPTLTTTTNDANCYTGGAVVGSSCTIDIASVNNSAAIIVGFNAAGRVATVPDPTILTPGRILYVTAANGSSDFTLRYNTSTTPIDIAMRANNTATLIWNGSDWTAAGASSSTDLQSAYNNTLTSAGGAEVVLNPSGGAADGLTIRNNATTPIVGGILEVQTSIGSNLLTVNNNATEYATNGGAETAGASSSTFPSSTWDTTTGGTVDRWTTAGDNVATGQASVRVQTTTTNHGARNRISTTLTSGLTYTVSFAVRGAANFTTLQVLYSPDGTTSGTTQCATAQTVTSGIWTRISCTFIASGTITSSNSILIRQTDATARTFYVDNLSVNVNASATFAVDGSVDLALGSNWTAFGTLDSLTRETSIIYDTSGSVNVNTPNSADRGVRNNLAITPAVSTQYLVTFYARSSNTFNDIRVRYSRDGGTNFVSCVDYNTQSVSTSTFVKITCLFTTDGTTPSNADLIIDQPTASDRNFYIDALTITLNTNNSNNVQVGGGNKGGPATLFTLDRSNSAPIAANNEAYLGSMYYDTTSGRIQCYEADGWGACGAAPDNIVNLNPEYAGAVLNGSGIGTMTADFCANQSSVLQVNYLTSSDPCFTSGDVKNYYKWTSPQATQQTYSIYVTYQLPATFNGFSSDDTVQLTGRVTDTANAGVTYQMYYKTPAGSLTQCWDSVTAETTVATSNNTWQSVGINGNEATGCSLSASAANGFIIFKINMKAKSNASAFVSTLSFTTTGR